MFICYPDIIPTDLAKLLLSLTMLLTFPLPFFTSREILILALVKSGVVRDGQNGRGGGDAEAPLIVLERDQPGEEEGEEQGAAPTQSSLLLPGEGNQLRLPYHIAWTVGLWMLVVTLAISAPNLGDVLDLVGCATGTLIAFVMPGLFSLQINGYSTQGAILLGVGGLVGMIGTIFSLQRLLRDS